MDYFEDKIKFSVALTYGLIIITCLTLCTLIDNTYFWNSARYGMQVKTAIIGLIYDKVIKYFLFLIFTLNWLFKNMSQAL